MAAAVARQGFGLGAQARQAADAALPSKAVQFCREVCRTLPWAVKNYKMDELTSVSELRANIIKLFRKHEGVKDERVIDLLVYKGREELEMVLLNHKQRHHLVSAYVQNPALREEKPSGMSPFMEAFLKSN